MKRCAWVVGVTILLLSMANGQNPFSVGSGIAKTTQGTSYTNAPYFEASYFAFNGLRSGTGWTFASDGASNGGAIMTGDVDGTIRFLTVPIKNGALAQSITDSQIGQYTRMYVGKHVEILNDVDPGLIVRTTHSFPYGYGVLSYVSQPYTKGLAVQLDDGNGNVAENFKVYGNGQVYAREINVMSGNFPDYVFQPEYRLTPLDQLRAYITQNRHLPNLPTAAEVDKQGLNVGATQVKLVEKIEELTLYILEQQKRIEALEKKLTPSIAGDGANQ